MRAGGAGCISATANVNPAAIYNLYKNWQSNEADALQEDLNDIRLTFQSFPMIPALKSAAGHWSGDDQWDEVRPPLVALTAEQKSQLITELNEKNFDMPGLAQAAAAE